MKFNLSYLVLVVSLSSFAASFRCDYEYISKGDGWFKLHATPRTWSEASYICNLEGAKLASPSTRAMKNVLYELMFGNIESNMIHIGRRPSDEDVIVIVDEPEAMILVDDGTERRGTKHDLYPFICHKVGGVDIELNECGTIDDEYKLDNRTGHCYKFHKNHTTWYNARKTCQIEGGHLAIINSEEEAQVMRDIYARNPEDSFLYYTDWNNVAFLGFLSLDKVSWVTINGKPLKAAGYDVFSPGEPNNARGDEFCGSVGRNGMLFDDPCTRNLPFICEKEIHRVCRPRYRNKHRISPLIKKLKRMDIEKREKENNSVSDI